MRKQDGIYLLNTIRQLGAKDDAVQAFLGLVEMEARAEVVGVKATQEFVDDYIIEKSLLELAKTLLILQTNRISLLTKELEEAQQNKPTPAMG
ncbi:hypothetical protein MKY96_32990 [Paenibacillus sp. FSL R7-0302]|uniref:hypothetical protein n=1 Tax=Paenibacillus sp. FSL R7-0302 TaxID=2921681 RepID=UPI0030FAD553